MKTTMQNQTETRIDFFLKNATPHHWYAKKLAKAEEQAALERVTFKWTLDGQTNREWTDEGEEYYTWQCIAKGASGVFLASLSGIDFGLDGTPWGEPYQRVVEAELALEALA